MTWRQRRHVIVMDAVVETKAMTREAIMVLKGTAQAVAIHMVPTKDRVVVLVT